MKRTPRTWNLAMSGEMMVRGTLLFVCLLTLCVADSPAAEAPSILSLQPEGPACKWVVYDPETNKESTIRTTRHCPIDAAWDIPAKKVYFLHQGSLSLARGAQIIPLKLPPGINPDHIAEGYGFPPIIAISDERRALRMAFSLERPDRSSHRIVDNIGPGQWAVVHDASSTASGPDVYIEYGLGETSEVTDRLKPAPASFSLRERLAPPMTGDGGCSCVDPEADASVKRFCSVLIGSAEAKSQAWAQDPDSEFACVRVTLSSGTVLYMPRIGSGEHSYGFGPAYVCQDQCRKLLPLGRGADYMDQPEIRVHGKYFLAGNVLGKAGSDKPLRILPKGRAIFVEKSEVPAL